MHLLDLALDALGGDPRVKGIVLERSVAGDARRQARLGGASGSPRSAPAARRSSGQQSAPETSSTACSARRDRIALPRAGRLELSGFLVEATAVGRAFEQLGIRPEFVRRGEHKTAPELFIRAEVSPNQRAAL